MELKCKCWFAFPLFALALSAQATADQRLELATEFDNIVKPFLSSYCIDCHSQEAPGAKFDLSSYTSFGSVTSDLGHWKLVLDRLRSGEMPPEDAGDLPPRESREQVVDWIVRLRNFEAQRNAGDPGPVLARRLSNAEYNYSIADLTGVDIRPTREFPVDPANESGFDNSGESLNMSPALLDKYLSAARHVADHLVFLPDGIDFADHPVVTYSDRDKHGVHRIVEFYNQQPVDLADYFYAAWRLENRVATDAAGEMLEDVAASERVSAKYLATLWELLTDTKDNVGPVATLRQGWSDLLETSDVPSSSISIRELCEQLRDEVVATRRELKVPVGNYNIKGLNKSAQPIILWKDREIAANRRRGRLPEADGTSETDKMREAIARFCAVVPDTFFVAQRGRMFINEGLDRAVDPRQRSSGRLLSAGFHLMFGFFRDDGPLYELILDADQQAELDQMWRELEFISRAPLRQYSDYIYFERAEYPGFLTSDEFAFAREDTEVTTESIERLAKLYLVKVREARIEPRVHPVIEEYFTEIAKEISQMQSALLRAESKHLIALHEFAERAWRLPLRKSDRDELDAFYRSLKNEVGLDHEDAIRGTLVSILMSPKFCYRVTPSLAGQRAQPLSSYDLASRLSYFLWSSLPDEELLSLARSGELRDVDVLVQESRRMLRDSRISRLATAFGGSWLDFRQFETHNSVNRERFPEFNDELRQAMYEEPVRFITDLLQRDGSVDELIWARHTFVNASLAEHYRMPFAADDPNRWIRVDEADQFGRGGLLPMAVFLTKNSPGLRTSPVKRGYWVVRRILGEHIPPPPPDVPELPDDETDLGDLSLREVLAKHREVAACAICHDKFDAIGLVFEGYGPIGERRISDLGGRAVADHADFPDGSQGAGLEGLGRYLKEKRRAEFVDNLCRKLFSFALGRSLLLSDEPAIESMKQRLETEDDRFGSLIESIVASPQFLRKRGRDFPTAQRTEITAQ